MKNNKVFLYCCSAFGMLTLVVVANYVCYHSAIKQFTKQQKSYEQELSEKMESQIARQVEDQWEQVEEQEEVAVDNTQVKLGVDTVYQVENYDVVKDQTTTEYLILPEELVGYDREQTDEYFKKYMNNLPVEEFLNGLQSTGVTNFSTERLVVHKVYDSSKIEYRYYLIAVDGEVVVYYGDKKTVFEYTGILTDNLSEKEQSALKQGIEVEDESALFGILENYSS